LWSASDFLYEDKIHMQKLLVATGNAGKLRELSELLNGVPFQLVSLADVGIDVDVEETGATLEENAALKATTYSGLSGLPTLADDSGLEVDALGGEPGVLSSRYAGEGTTDAQRIEFLLKKLRETSVHEEHWDARFKCVIAISMPSEPVELYSGECPGRIISESRGSNGFGYDPVFLFPHLERTMAELSSEEKNDLSHRSAAARKAAAVLREKAAI